MALWQYALILGAGLVAGFVNAMAGGGSLLTLPALMVGGMPSLLANGSNRLGILSQGIAAMLIFRRGGVQITLRDWLHAIPVVVGGLVGAYFAGQVQARVMDVVIAIVLIGMCGMLFVNPKRWKPRVYTEQGRAWREVLMVAVFLLAGFYGGFIQVGVGYMFLFTLIFLEGKDLITANAIKGLIMFGPHAGVHLPRACGVAARHTSSCGHVGRRLDRGAGGSETGGELHPLDHGGHGGGILPEIAVLLAYSSAETKREGSEHFAHSPLVVISVYLGCYDCFPLFASNAETASAISFGARW